MEELTREEKKEIIFLLKESIVACKNKELTNSYRAIIKKLEG